jgi:hypothetical protein
MPLLVLWGHGVNEDGNGSFEVPENVEIHFFVPDGEGLGNGAARIMASSLRGGLIEDGNSRSGISDEIIAKAKKAFDGINVKRTVFTYQYIVKDYTLESMVDLPLGGADEESVREVCSANPSVCMSPGIGVGKGSVKTGAARSHLKYVVHKYLRNASAKDPLIINWAACRDVSEG